MAKLLIDLRNGRIEVEGDEKFVERVYSEFREATLDQISNLSILAPERPADENKVSESTDGVSPPPKVRKRVKAGGPSCASRIGNLKDEEFFKSPRTPLEIRNKLSEKGTTYNSNNVAAALTDLIKAGKLRRFKEDGHWKYQNP